MNKLYLIVAAAAFLLACDQKNDTKASDTTDSQSKTEITTKAGSKEKSTSEGSGSEFKTDADKYSYAIGAMQGGRMTQDLAISLNKELLVKGFSDGVNNNSTMSEEEIKANLQEFQKLMQEAMKKKREAESAAAVKEGAAFMKANAKKEGVKVTDSGLQYKVIVPGDGKNRPKATDKVSVHYTGTLVNGKKFDSSVDKGKPATFGLNGVIKGWTEGLQYMSVGAKYQFYIPAELGYGTRGTSGIPPNSVLIFDVELLDIQPTAKEKKASK